MRRPTRSQTARVYRAWKMLDGSLDRVDGPAVEWDDGTKYWYSKGVILIVQRGDGHRIWAPTERMNRVIQSDQIRNIYRHCRYTRAPDYAAYLAGTWKEGQSP